MPKISFVKNGPILVTDLESFRNSRGEPIRTGKRLSLCRCGASKTKPFCDGTHHTIEFRDPL